MPRGIPNPKGVDFLKGLQAIDRKIKAAARQGMIEALADLGRAALEEEPKIPYDYGTLRASESHFVTQFGRTECVYTSPFPVDDGAKIAPNPLTEMPARFKKNQQASGMKFGEGDGSVSGVVVFNTPYAAAIHGGIAGRGLVENWGIGRIKRGLVPDPGTGALFLSWKMVGGRGMEYMKRIAERVQAAISSGNVGGGM